ncbi:MAG: type II toxin-antitoxin system RelE/ParE family toxin [Desulfovibrionaceae bacterium]
MAWRIEFTPRAAKELAKLGTREARRIATFLRERVAPDPRAIGGQLTGELRYFWRWRVGNYRILARIEDDRLLILVVAVGHRSKIYRTGQ